MTEGQTIQQVPPNKDVPPRRIGCASLSLGVLLIIVGVPMLVLPGPGIAAILGGIALMMRGLKRRAERPVQR